MRPDESATVSTGAASGDQLADISRALVQLHKECYGKGPTKARTYVSGDLVVCILQGGFTQAEQTLHAHGRDEVIQDQREAFQDALRQRFIEVVEGIVGRKVVSFMSGVDVHTETASEVFLLHPRDLAVGDEREAVGRWGERTREQSRVLRTEQATLREEQASLRRSSETARRTRR